MNATGSGPSQNKMRRSKGKWVDNKRAKTNEVWQYSEKARAGAVPDSEDDEVVERGQDTRQSKKEQTKPAKTSSQTTNVLDVTSSEYPLVYPKIKCEGHLCRHTVDAPAPRCFFTASAKITCIFCRVDKSAIDAVRNNKGYHGSSREDKRSYLTDTTKQLLSDWQGAVRLNFNTELPEAVVKQFQTWLIDFANEKIRLYEGRGTSMKESKDPDWDQLFGLKPQKRVKSLKLTLHMNTQASSRTACGASQDNEHAQRKILKPHPPSARARQRHNLGPQSTNEEIVDLCDSVSQTSIAPSMRDTIARRAIRTPVGHNKDDSADDVKPSIEGSTVIDLSGATKDELKDRISTNKRRIAELNSDERRAKRTKYEQVVVERDRLVDGTAETKETLDKITKMYRDMVKKHKDLTKRRDALVVEAEGAADVRDDMVELETALEEQEALRRAWTAIDEAESRHLFSGL